MRNCFSEKTILITGGTGSIGSEIARKLLTYNPKTIRILARDDTNLFNLGQELKSEKMRFLIGDIRDKERLKRAISDVDIVFHAAALKHVPLCEYNPFEAVKTNVIGLQNLIDVAISERVEKFINISTDKVVNPVSVMGATKLLAERLIVSANYHTGIAGKPAFSCVRFGNVFDTRGSVMSLFRNQVKAGGPLIVTNPSMTRFSMSVSEAVGLVLRAAEMTEGGELFILKLPALLIGDLAEVVRLELGPRFGYNDIEIRVVGKRAGEKLHEELMTGDEAETAYEDEEMFIVVSQGRRLPSNFKKAQKVSYSSENARRLTRDELRAMIGNDD